MKKKENQHITPSPHNPPPKWSFKILFFFLARILVWYNFETVLFECVLDPSITYIFFKILIHKYHGQHSRKLEIRGNWSYVGNI